MPEGLRSRMRVLGALGNRIGTILPGTKMACALVILFGLVNLFAHTHGEELFVINHNSLSLPPKIWVLFCAVFYERSTLMVNE